MTKCFLRKESIKDSFVDLRTLREDNKFKNAGCRMCRRIPRTGTGNDADDRKQRPINNRDRITNRFNETDVVLHNIGSHSLPYYISTLQPKSSDAVPCSCYFSFFLYFIRKWFQINDNFLKLNIIEIYNHLIIIKYITNVFWDIL